MTYGDKIKQIREEILQISQEELARRLGLKDKSSVCKIEKAGNNVSIKSIRKYAEALNTTVAHIMGISNGEQNDEYLDGIEASAIQIHEEDERAIGTAGIALKIALYRMDKANIQKLYDIAKIMDPQAFEGEKS